VGLRRTLGGVRMSQVRAFGMFEDSLRALREKGGKRIN
jgi:hypothetical protein